MNRLIPGKTKVQVELFRGVKIGDIIVSVIGIAMIVLVLVSSLPYKLAFAMGIVLVAAVLLIRMDAYPNYRYLMHVIAHFAYKRRYKRIYDDALLVERAKGNEMDTLVDRIFTGERSGEGPEDKKTAKARKWAQKAAGKKTEKQAKAPEKKPETGKAPGAKSGGKADKRAAKAEEKERKREDKLLADPKTPQEVKDEILQKRKEAAEKNFYDGFAKTSETGEQGQEPEGGRKLTRKEEDALLKSDKVSEVEKEAIRERRRRESAAFAQKLAQEKEKKIAREMMQDLIGFTDISEGYIEYGKDYFGGVIEIDPVEFRFFSELRRRASIHPIFEAKPYTSLAFFHHFNSPAIKHHLRILHGAKICLSNRINQHFNITCCTKHI